MRQVRDPAPVAVTPTTTGAFLLEIVALIGFARWGWHLGEGRMLGLALSALFVALAGAIWGIFRTRGFVPNGSDPLVAIPGPARLVLELAFYLLASWGLWVSGWRLAGLVLVVCVVAIYLLMRERTTGLLHNKPPSA